MRPYFNGEFMVVPDTDLVPGRHERIGKREKRLGWCLTHERPSPTSNTYCHNLWWLWRVDPCVIRWRELTGRAL